MASVVIASAYANLTPVERAFTDKVVRTICAAAERDRVRPSDVVKRPIDTDKLGPNAAELLRRHGVQAAIHEALRDVGTVITVDGVMTELWSVVHSNIDDFLQVWDDGTRSDIDLSKVPREKLAAVREYTVEQFPDGRRKTKIGFWDKLKGVEVFMQMQDRLPAAHPYKALRPNPNGPASTLPATLTEAEAAEQYARLLSAA